VKEEKEDSFPSSHETSNVQQPVKKRPLRRESSWRQAIYHSVVVTNSRRSSSSSIVTITGENDERKNKAQSIDVGERARSRWRNAIHNQILLIRMEKENKKLAANISATEIRRQKLSYQDLASYTAEAAQAWDDLIGHKNNEKIDRQYLLELVRGGIPRARRGEVWQFLINQNQFRKPDTSDKQCWKETPYRTLLKRNSGHQHAILIDLGRTFPTHAHFIPRLGSGQISLFNILAAYSQLDDEVGYCQGLSFVAGVLLMHMPEEEAFQSFCHLMFELQIRSQYKPDMDAVQQQLYQLSRLLHDYHPKVYEHFNKFDVTPTLYAAPWFLTLYASQYPIGFVSRVMDMVLLEGMEVIFKVALVLIGNHANEILEKTSFESIVDYMKLELPNKVVTETDDVSMRALNMDIRQQLNLYEVEYQLLNEEMLDIRQSKEKLEKQEAVLEEVKKQMSDLKNELAESQQTVQILRGSLDEANQRNLEYEQKIEALIKENKMLKASASSSQTDGQNTDKNWNLVPSPPTIERDMNGRRAFSLDSSVMSSEENIADL